jgi:hypothetical protein
MEHRIGRRRKLEIEVELMQFGKTFGRFMTRDVSLGGIGLRGDVARLQPNSVVTLCLLPDEADNDETMTMRAMVVHQQDGRIGLMWIEDEMVFPAVMVSVRYSSQTSVKRPILS